ncbi:hypothetical protein GCM10027341_34860 [Spirosoma knui]
MRSTLLCLLLTLLGTRIFAQDAQTARQNELDGVIKELQTNGYDAVKNKKITLRVIHYVSGTSNLTFEDKQYLDTIAVFLTRVPTVVMEIAGHTDNVGNKKANLQLSQERANSVMQYVISRGVLSRRIKSAGYGSRQPIAENKTDMGRAQNRRVEMRFVGLTNDVYTIVTKSGQKIPATYMVIGADGRSISYRANANAPLTRVPTSGIGYVEYPDGSRHRPDVVMLSNSGEGTQPPTNATTPSRTIITDVASEQSESVEAGGPVHSIIKYAPLTNFGYEHVLSSKRSIYAGLSLYSLGFGVSAIGLKGEYRFYGLIKDSPKQAPEGFWVAPTALLWHVSDRFDETESVFITQLGCIAGYQWIFNRKVSLEPALGLSITAVGSGSDSSLGAGVLPLFALRVGYVLK